MRPPDPNFWKMRRDHHREHGVPYGEAGKIAHVDARNEAIRLDQADRDHQKKLTEKRQETALARAERDNDKVQKKVEAFVRGGKAERDSDPRAELRWIMENIHQTVDSIAPENIPSVRAANLLLLCQQDEAVRNDMAKRTLDSMFKEAAADAKRPIDDDDDPEEEAETFASISDAIRKEGG